jgi:hypothetical protein
MYGCEPNTSVERERELRTRAIAVGAEECDDSGGSSTRGHEQIMVTMVEGERAELKV